MSSSVSSTVTSSCSPRLRRTSGAVEVEQHLAALAGHTELDLVRVPEAAPGQGGAGDRADRAVAEAQRDRVVELDRAACRARQRRDLGRPLGQQPEEQAQTVRELALAVAAARYLRIAPCLGSWR